MTLETLFNSGIKAIGDEAALAAPEKTLIVVGPGRGGTSLVSGALHHLGVFTGETSRAPTFEDARLDAAFRSGEAERVQGLVDDYNARHRVWAFKRPASLAYLDQLHQVVRNPVYLFIFKDIFSIANRNDISMQWNLKKGLRTALRSYRQMVDFIDGRAPNGLMLSYDRVVQNKETFIDTLTELVAPHPVSSEQREAALGFINPNPPEYLNASRVTRAVGSVSQLTETSVAGTAKYKARPRRPVTVEVLVNDDVVGSIDADSPAEEDAGFAFRYDFPTRIGAEDVVALRLSEDVVPFVEGLRLE